jgi:dATP pyrophosphohydrolase
MPDVSSRLVDVYPYRLIKGIPQFLLLRRAPDVAYAGQWRMVGGGIEDGETAWEAGLRELREETGQVPAHFWALPSANRFYEWETDRVHVIPAFAAEITGEPTLNHEHDRADWFAPNAAAGRLLWPEPKRLVHLAARCLQDGIPPSCVIPGRLGA